MTESPIFGAPPKKANAPPLNIQIVTWILRSHPVRIIFTRLLIALAGSEDINELPSMR
jgi:hypothetical protein